MTKLRVFNVGHGEAMVIQLDNKVSIIRDFGRSKSAVSTCTSISIDRILKCCPQQCFTAQDRGHSLDVVLSHAHEDHFNGFLRLHNGGERKIFRNSYIPWIDFDTFNSLGGQILKLSLYIYTYYGLNHPDGEKSHHWILMAPVMLELSNRLYGVSSGYKINTWTPNGHILWPPPPGSNYYKKKAEAIARKIQEIEENIGDPEKVSEFNTRIFKPIFTTLKRIYPENPEGFTSNENNENSGLRTINEALERTNEYTQRFNQIHIKATTVYSHNWTLDDHSIAFQLMSGSDHVALFMSDMTSRRINQMLQINGLNNIRYKLLKSAHHGSRFGHMLLKNNIKADNVLHCCGPANSNWQGPNDNYTAIGNDIVCTDWNNKSTLWPKLTKSRNFSKCCEEFII